MHRCVLQRSLTAGSSLGHSREGESKPVIKPVIEAIRWKPGEESGAEAPGKLFFFKEPLRAFLRTNS